MGFSAEALGAFFETYGWDFEQRDDSIFRTGFVGTSGQYDIWLKVTDGWVYFAINPYVARRGDEPVGNATLLMLLRANHELNLAKFAVDEDGDICLAVELPSMGFCYGHFADALTALAHYADEWRQPFDAAMAQDAAEVV